MVLHGFKSYETGSEEERLIASQTCPLNSRFLANSLFNISFGHPIYTYLKVNMSQMELLIFPPEIYSCYTFFISNRNFKRSSYSGRKPKERLLPYHTSNSSGDSDHIKRLRTSTTSHHFLSYHHGPSRLMITMEKPLNRFPIAIIALYCLLPAI